MELRNNTFVETILKSQSDFYKDQLTKFGESPQAVASESVEIKELRYTIIGDLLKDDDFFSIHDVGFGLCHLYTYLSSRFPEKTITYSGTEVCKEFFEYAQKRLPQCSFYHRNILGDIDFPELYDYVIMSGTFYQNPNISQNEYRKYVNQMIEKSFSLCQKGVIFNLISDYGDYYKEGLFYYGIQDLISYIIMNVSRFFKINHSYPLYEYSVIILKPEFMQEKYSNPAYNRYFSKYENDGK